MGIINKALFVKLLTDGPVPVKDRYGYTVFMDIPAHTLRAQLPYAVGTSRGITEGVIDRESALAVYDEMRSYIGINGYMGGKYLRPWHLDPDMFTRLNRDEAWWGLEFETGWKSLEDRTRAVHHAWDTWDNVVFDSEGEGVAVEITFAPQEMSKYFDGSANAAQFADFLTHDEGTRRTASEKVGMHLNLSHPNITQNNLYRVVMALNRTLAHLPVNDGYSNVRKHMFGRAQLYGGFFIGEGVQPYTEGKLFRTTYDWEEFQKYLRVCKALTTAAVALADTPNNVGDKTLPFISNLYEVFKDEADPVIAWSHNLGRLDGVRGNGLINGAYARDRINGDEEVIPAGYVEMF